MSTRQRTLPWLFALASLVALIGCPPRQPESGSDMGAVDALDQPAELGSPAASPTESEDSSAVMLGTAALTSGIPGEGPLSVEEVRGWIDTPENHETLEIELPLGLSLGKAQIQGLDQNPLTRAKIELGRQLYFDPRMSADMSISCASCHHPDEGFAQRTQFGVGIGEQQGNRNSPVSYNRILSAAQFWDGRAESLEEQAKGPIANPIEMGNTHDVCVETIQNNEGYRIQFEKIFADGAVNIDNIARAIAAFERVLVTGPAPYDYYEALRPFRGMAPEDIQLLTEDDPETAARYESLLAASRENPMSESAIRGRDLFFSDRVGCTACHVGANFTDEKYHNLGIGMDQESPDLGRYEVTKDDKDRGAFKTPTIRNVVYSAPYMHDGSLKTLEEVVDWYDKGGHPNDHLSDKIKKLNLTDQEKKDLVEFMKACTGEFPEVQRDRLPQ